MKVKITTIGAILLVGILLFFSAYAYALYSQDESSAKEENKEQKEGFVDAPIPTRGILLSACPADSTAFIDENGDTICCQGTIVDGKCVGREICSFTASSARPSCSEWYAADLQEKGRGRCPATLPNYFESKKGQSGCTNGLLNKDGTGPANAQSRKCILYKTMADDNEKLDSCANVKMLDEAVCFPGSSVAARKTLVRTERGKPPVVQCTIVDPVTRSPISCTTDASYTRYKDSTNDRDWKSKINNAKGDAIYRKLDFCSVAFKYKVQKSAPFSQLARERVFP